MIYFGINIVTHKVYFLNSRMNSYIKQLHGYDYGFFSIEKNRKKWEYKFYKDIDNIYINTNEKDVYISQNTFKEKQRRLIYLNELRALYIDIDCYTKNLSKEATKYFIENDLEGIIPRPNIWVDSGNGLYYIIFLENTYANELPKWQLVEQFLYEKLEQFGADSKCLDATRVLRVPNTINSKNNERVKILETYDYTYTLDEIIEHYIPDVKIEQKKEKQKTTNKSKVKNSGGKKFVSLYTTYNLYYTRYKDILKLSKIRNYDMEGYRETTLFLVRYFLGVYLGDEKALKEALELNKLFKNPLTEKEVIKATSSATVGATENRYKYSNNKLIKLLDITPSEQREMDTIISKEEKYYRNNTRRKNKRRNSSGLTNKELKKLNNINRIKKIMEENKNYTVTSISKELTLSKSYVSKLIKEILS